jgi:hypothetical protein
MFANPIWSILLLTVPVAVYWFVIRPRLQSRFTEIYAGLDSFWARVWARLYAFRTFFIASFGVVLTALPDLLVAFAPIDFSEILPRPWGLWVGTGVSVAIALLKAFETKPGEDKV